MLRPLYQCKTPQDFAQWYLDMVEARDKEGWGQTRESKETLLVNLFHQAMQQAAIHPRSGFFDPKNHHPELQEGEQLLLNVTQREFNNWAKNAKVMNMEYLRLGQQAYTTNGEPVDPQLNFRPMFGKPRG